MERKQFTFYGSFYMAIQGMKRKSDQADLYNAICQYALYGEEPALSPSLQGIFELIRPNLDASRRKAENGKRGGNQASKAKANGKQTRSKPKASRKQTASEKENEIENEIEVEKEIEDECPPPSAPPKGGWGVPEGPLLDALRGFEEMRRKSRKPLTDRAKALLLGNLRKLSQDEATQVAILEQSILKGWQDVYALKGEPERQKETSYNLDKIKAAMMGGDWK